MQIFTQVGHYRVGFQNMFYTSETSAGFAINVLSMQLLHTELQSCQISENVYNLQGNVVAIKKLNVQNVEERTALLLEFKQVSYQ